MKKKVIAILIAVAVVLCFSTVAQAAQKITILVDGKTVESDVPAYIDGNNRTMVPIRFVAEALQGNVSWDGKVKKVTIARNNTTILLWIGKKSYSVNNASQNMDTIPNIKEGRTMVPLRFVAESLCCQVTWDSKNYIVRVESDNGYDLPEITDLREIEVSANDPNKVDVNMLADITEPDFEGQLNDIYNVLASKHGADTAKQVVDYCSLKKDRWTNVDRKRWTTPAGYLIVAVSYSGYVEIQVTVYKP
jgi:hypothetical protein